MDKQIDEMARILTLCPRNTCVGCGMACIDYRMAKAIYNAGYRKIPEGAVVIPKKHYELYMNEFHNYEVGKRDGSKETAEKFAERLKESLDISVEGYSTSEVINEIEDKIDEICKEITEGKV